MKTNVEIKIVEYSETLAKGVADMWNRSSEGWNGRVYNETRDSVLATENASQHLKLYIAVEASTLGDENPLVLGYCKVSKYFFDEDTLYINLLNVDPAYHGAKIGKLLVLKAVDFTVAYGYPRLDLFTWPGNTKAVPLYKKCGFFWENAENASTHLMNFMPLVQSQPLLKPYFNKTSWYEASTREIVVEPDGTSHFGTEHYIYSWENQGDKLKVEIEKTSRNIVGIDTEDFELKLIQSDHKRIFSASYSMQVAFTPKKGKTFDLSILGQSHKTIETHIQFDGSVSESLVLEGNFFVHPVDEDQNEWKTHPSLSVNVWVNGEKITLRSGIKPQKPLSIEFINEESTVRAGKENYLRMAVENHLQNSATFRVDLGPITGIELQEKEVAFKLKAGEKATKSLKYVTEESYADYVALPVEIFETGTKYTQKSSLKIAVYGGRNFGQTYQHDMLIHDTKFVQLDRYFEFNEVTFIDIKTESYIYLVQPMVGLPYSSEFERKCYSDVRFENDKKLTMSHVYDSYDFVGARFSRHLELTHTGALKIWHECLGLPSTGSLNLAVPIATNEVAIYLPYDGYILKMDDLTMGNLDLSGYDLSKVDEPWIYLKMRRGSVAIAWDESKSLKYAGHRLQWDETLSAIGETTSPIFVHLDEFMDAATFRNYVFGKKMKAKTIKDGLRVDFEGQNPFVKDVSLRMNLVKVQKGSQEMDGGKFEVKANEKIFEQDPKETLILPVTKAIQTLEGVLDNGSKVMPFRSTAFKLGQKVIEKQMLDSEGMKVYKVDNGLISFEASPDFFSGLHSIKVENEEQLSSSFPKPYPKSWYNPWFGGCFTNFTEVSARQLSEEKNSVDFIALEDQWGNLWEGLAIRVSFEKHSKFKGIILTNYYLTQAGIPVLAHFTSVFANQDIYKKKQLISVAFYSDEVSELQYASENRIFSNKRTGVAQEHIVSSGHIKMCKENQNFINHVFSDGPTVFPCIDKETVYTESFEHVIIEKDKKYMTSVDVLVAHKEDIPFGALEHLRNLCFNVK